jgi:uracil phosphoribosyltransferase
MAHAVLKEMFLKTTVIDQQTGRELTYIRSSTDLNTVEFNEYLDRIAEFLATECGFVVPEPDAYREAVE